MSGPCAAPGQARAGQAFFRTCDGQAPRARKFGDKCSHAAPPETCVLEYVDDGDDQYWLVHDMCAVEANAPAPLLRRSLVHRFMLAMTSRLSQIRSMRIDLLRSVGFGTICLVFAIQLAQGWSACAR